MSPLDSTRKGDHGAAPWIRLPVIVTAALALRLGWSLLVPMEPVSDGVLYDAFAWSIANGKGYAFPAGDLTAYWPVGAPAAYAAMYAVFGHSYAMVTAWQAVLGAAIVAMTWRLARRFFGPVAAALAAWAVAVWPLLIEFTTVLASELLFMALLLAALNVWLARRMSLVPRAMLWGALIAAASFVRPTAWPLLLIFPLCGWLADRRLRTALVMLLVSSLTAALLFAPWVARNYRVFDQFVLVATNGGPNLWMGNNPQSNGGYMALPDEAFANEADRDRHFGRLAVDFITSEPLAYLRLALRRIVITYSRETIGVAWNEAGLQGRFGFSSLPAIKAVSTAYWWAMLIVAAAGIWRSLPRHGARRLWPLLVALGFFGAVPILTVAQDRYHMPMDPLLAIFASVGILGFSPRQSRHLVNSADHA